MWLWRVVARHGAGVESGGNGVVAGSNIPRAELPALANSASSLAEVNSASSVRYDE